MKSDMEKNMTRNTAQTTDRKLFQIDVDNLGRFVFYHRTLRDEMRIGAEYSRLTEGVEQPTRWLELFANMFSAITVLLHEAPEGWVLDALDPLDANSYQQISAVYNALRSEEARFRDDNGDGGESAGPGNGRINRPVVSQTIQPDSERPAISELDFA